MTRSLVIKCKNCGGTLEASDPAKLGANALGEIVQRAAKEGHAVSFCDEPVVFDCECEPTDSATGYSGGRSPHLRINLRQAMLLVTTVAILLAIFRHPISLLFDERVRPWAAAPWSVYGWLFFGTPITDPKAVAGKHPMGIIVFTVNVVIAMILPIGVGITAINGFKRLWVMTASRKDEASPQAEGDE